MIQIIKRYKFILVLLAVLSPLKEKDTSSCGRFRKSGGRIGFSFEDGSYSFAFASI
ncbi:hypothetical protein LEP1GSC081_0226 [Leptospira kirschneri str. H1]|uniref:Uncharacterized protein n=1 Tax=Leptospira kirschneri str. H1 TaxID=1049966 RepID=A0A0E2B8X1_9LEPT|nr:hypothetical protein LEP1GSC081_0226 [Leptospira kirschneri str. H1]